MSHQLSFRHGGLSLESKRSWGLPSSIPNAFLPAQALVLLRQNGGPAARCLVSIGDFVREGALIGKGEAIGAAHVHAPVPGIVRDIREVREADGKPCLAVEILLQGNFDRLGKREERYVWTSMSRADLVQTIRDRGVVEMGESGRPVVDILGEGGKTEALILNCIESEPWVRTENAVLHERHAAVLEGFAILRRLLEPARAMAAIEHDQEGEFPMETRKELGKAESALEVVEFLRRYPQDLPNQLLSALRVGRSKLGEGRMVIVRPSTALAIAEAVIAAKPVIERYVTIAGGAIKHPAVLKARIGTPIGDLVEECGGFVGKPEKILIGGPLRGRPVHDLDVPVTKQTQAVLALAGSETGWRSRSACIRCNRCNNVCPERLAPAEIFRRLEANRAEDALALGLTSCTLCGACGYTCPSRIALVETMAAARGEKEARR